MNMQNQTHSEPNNIENTSHKAEELQKGNDVVSLQQHHFSQISKESTEAQVRETNLTDRTVVTTSCVNALAQIEHLYFKNDGMFIYRVAVDVGCQKATGCLLPSIRQKIANQLREWCDEYAPELPKRSGKRPVLRRDGDEAVRIVNPPKELEDFILRNIKG